MNKYFRKLNKQVANLYYEHTIFNSIEVIAPLFCLAIFFIPLNEVEQLIDISLSVKHYLLFYIGYAVALFFLYYRTTLFEHYEELYLVKLSLFAIVIVFGVEYLLGIENSKFHFLITFCIWNIGLLLSTYNAVITAKNDHKELMQKVVEYNSDKDLVAKQRWKSLSTQERNEEISQKNYVILKEALDDADFKKAKSIYIEIESTLFKHYKEPDIFKIKERIFSIKNWQCRCGYSVQQYYKPEDAIGCKKNRGNRHFLTEL